MEIGIVSSAEILVHMLHINLVIICISTLDSMDSWFSKLPKVVDNPLKIYHHFKKHTIYFVVVDI
jgi:hypothetical protein